jgi:disulfide bond formation protein DsbB
MIVIQTDTTKLIERLFNSLEVVGIILVLLLAFSFQIIFHELPCPLCLLQRVGFIGIAFGFLLNLRFGLRPSHYAIVILSALFTSFVALRQIALHVAPGTGAYGTTVFGLHMYTWSFVISMLIILVTTILLSIDRQYQKSGNRKTQFKFLTHALFVVTLLIILANATSVFLECGIRQCPDNPTQYKINI